MNKFSILSISLIGLTLNSIVVPLLGDIFSEFSEVSPFLIKGLLTIPPFFVLCSSLAFPYLSSVFKTKTLALLGIFIYSIGLGIIWTDNIENILVLRSISGIGVGIMMPLTISMISTLFFEDKVKMLGYASGFNQLGSVVGVLFSSYFALNNWRDGFYFHFIGIIVALTVLLFLPNIKLNVKNVPITIPLFKKYFLYSFSIFCTMGILFVIPAHLSIFMAQEQLGSKQSVVILLMIQPFFSFLGGMNFSTIERYFKQNFAYFALSLYLIAFIIFSFSTNIILLGLAMILVGYGFGLLIPWVHNKAATKAPQSELAPVMSLMNFALFFSLFTTPNILQAIQEIFSIQDIRFPFYAGTIAIILFTRYLQKNTTFYVTQYHKKTP